MGTKLSDVTKQEAQKIQSGTLWEVAEYQVPVAPIMALYRLSRLEFFVPGDVQTNGNSKNGAAVNTSLCVTVMG